MRHRILANPLLARRNLMNNFLSESVTSNALVRPAFMYRLPVSMYWEQGIVYEPSSAD